MKVLVAALLVVVCVLLTDCALLPVSLEEELSIYQRRVLALHRLLAVECPEYIKQRRYRRKLTGDVHAVHLKAEKIVFNQLTTELIECRGKRSTSQPSNVEKQRSTSQPSKVEKQRSTSQPSKVEKQRSTSQPSKINTQSTTIKKSAATSGKTTPFTTTGMTTSTTAEKTTPSTTTRRPQSKECQIATNLAESWRLDHTGSKIEGGGPHSYYGWACDIHIDLQWFRFTGAAGNRMLNTCPKYKSCGARVPFWTDETMPSRIGVTTTVDVFGVHSSRCKGETIQLEVMRCSWDTDHDLIYRLPNALTGTCWGAFCGML